MNIPVTARKRSVPASPASQAGAYIMELALVAVIFFTLLFGVIELARALFLWNTVQEVVRRAAREASVTDFSNPGAMALVRQRAVFRDTPGKLLLGAPVTDDYVRIDYMALEVVSPTKMKQVDIPKGSLPACPARNLVNCTANPHGPNCIRLVRVRICTPGDAECKPVPYQPLVGIAPMPLTLPVAESVVRAESLGYEPGTSLCN